MMSLKIFVAKALKDLVTSILDSIPDSTLVSLTVVTLIRSWVVKSSQILMNGVSLRILIINVLVHLLAVDLLSLLLIAALEIILVLQYHLVMEFKQLLVDFGHTVNLMLKLLLMMSAFWSLLTI